MFKLRYGYLVTGIILGLIILALFIRTIHDGKLHITFCDVGQGDAAYILFPFGNDMVVDGGPNDRILQCLGNAMPFWDRHIDMVLMTHPQRDHSQGLISVLQRFDVDYFVRSDIDNETEGYKKLLDVIRTKNIPVRFETAGDRINIGTITLTFIWPSHEQITKAHENVLGVNTNKEINDFSMVFRLSYGSFDALFTGDADSHVEALYPYELLASKPIEVLKFPHHGSKTAVTDEFLRIIQPKISIISVGKNSYGHPSNEVLDKLNQIGSHLYRTDLQGDLKIISDGNNWKVETYKNPL